MMEAAPPNRSALSDKVSVGQCFLGLRTPRFLEYWSLALIGILMLTGDLVRVRYSRERVIPLYLNRNSPQWLEAAKSLLVIFRDGVGTTRGEIDAEVDDLFGGGGKASQVYRGLAKVLEDRAEFEVVADVAPELIREKVFTAAAESRQRLRHQRSPTGLPSRSTFRREPVLNAVAKELNLAPDMLLSSLFADLRNENRLLRFDDMTAQRLIDRYNVALAQAVLLRSVRVEVEVRDEGPPRYRQLFRRLKFHRLVYRVRGSMADGYTLQIDGPLSLFSATTKYGLQMALFLPALLHCNQFRLHAELRWGPRREPRSFHLDQATGLVTHQLDSGLYVPAEIPAFVERFRQVAPAWELSQCTEIIELGQEGVWVPDYRAVHKVSGTDVFIEVVGFWKKSSLERLLKLLPHHGPPRFVLVISDKLKVDEAAIGALPGPILWFKEIPSSPELAALLDMFLTSG
jgi:predicted nuclease of restriction endonuclease-like RecB superfamily